MSKHSISIDDKLYEEIAEYCKLNSLKISTFCNDLLRNGLNNEKYGDIPFGVIKKPSFTKTEQELAPVQPMNFPTAEPLANEMSELDNEKNESIQEYEQPVQIEKENIKIETDEIKDKKQITVKRRKL